MSDPGLEAVLASLEASIQGLKAEIAKLVEVNRILCGNEAASATGLIEGRVSVAMELAAGHHVELAKELDSALDTGREEKLTYPIQPVVPLSHCPGCRCDELARTESVIRDRFNNLGKQTRLGEGPPPHAQYETLMREIRAGNFNTLGKRQARTCTHGVVWDGMSYQHWITYHEGDHP